MPAPNSLEKFAEAYGGVAAANRRSLGRLEAILRAFEARSVDCLLLKGADLVTRGDRGLGMRPIGDFDLLVREKDLAAIDVAMRGLDYRPQINGNPAYIGPGEDFPVDLATEVWYLEDPEAIWRRSIKRTALGLSVRCMNPTDALLFVCLYVCLHRGHFSAVFAEDIAMLAKETPIDWRRAVQEASSLGLKVPLLHSLRYALSKRSVEIPVWALEALTPSTAVERLQLRLLSRLVTQTRLQGVSHLLVALTRPRGKRFAGLRKSIVPDAAFLAYRYGALPARAMRRARLARPFHLAWQASGLAARLLQRILTPVHESAR